MFKTRVFNKMNYQLFRGWNVGHTWMRKATVTKINHWENISATMKAINCEAEWQHRLCPGVTPLEINAFRVHASWAHGRGNVSSSKLSDWCARMFGCKPKPFLLNIFLSPESIQQLVHLFTCGYTQLDQRWFYRGRGGDSYKADRDFKQITWLTTWGWVMWGCVRGKPSVFRKSSLRWYNLDTAEAYNRANPADSGVESTQN